MARNLRADALEQVAAQYIGQCRIGFFRSLVNDRNIANRLHQCRLCLATRLGNDRPSLFPVRGGDPDLDEFMVSERPVDFLENTLGKAFAGDDDNRFQMMRDGFEALFFGLAYHERLNQRLNLERAAIIVDAIACEYPNEQIEIQ